jgi:YggT family protein
MGLVTSLILFALQIFRFILLARVLLSWFPDIDRNNSIVQFIFDVTEPVLRPIRDLLPPTSGIDFSPLLVFLAISILMGVL